MHRYRPGGKTRCDAYDFLIRQQARRVRLTDDDQDTQRAFLSVGSPSTVVPVPQRPGYFVVLEEKTGEAVASRPISVDQLPWQLTEVARIILCGRQCEEHPAGRIRLKRSPRLLNITSIEEGEQALAHAAQEGLVASLPGQRAVRRQLVSDSLKIHYGKTCAARRQRCSGPYLPCSAPPVVAIQIDDVAFRVRRVGLDVEDRGGSVVRARNARWLHVRGRCRHPVRPRTGFPGRRPRRPA